MSSEVEKLRQLLDSTFGLAFLAHLVGSSAWDILSHQQSPLSIASNADAFTASNLHQPIFQIYSDFIREYPFGSAQDWMRLAEELSAAVPELTRVLSEIAPELVECGFAAGFNHTKQFSVLTDAVSEAQGFQPIWKSNADAWWTHPNTVPSFQGCSANLSEFAIDDGMVSPTAMKSLSVDDLEPVFGIGSAQDWLRLVDRYPIEASVLHLEKWWPSVAPPLQSVWIPDWRRVSEDYAGVYLSPAAYLGASYSFLQLPNGRATFLSGWSPGATYWLPQS
ncbi:MAG: hypothetical protein RL716_1160 [Actinomycetota bacterium]|jgi:hypothetical protein